MKANSAIRKTLLTKEEIRAIDNKYVKKLQKLMKEFETEYIFFKKKAKSKLLTHL